MRGVVLCSPGRKGTISDKLEGGCANCCAKYCRMTPMTQALCCSKSPRPAVVALHTVHMVIPTLDNAHLSLPISLWVICGLDTGAYGHADRRGWPQCVLPSLMSLSAISNCLFCCLGTVYMYCMENTCYLHSFLVYVGSLQSKLCTCP